MAASGDFTPAWSTSLVHMSHSRAVFPLELLPSRGCLATCKGIFGCHGAQDVTSQQLTASKCRWCEVGTSCRKDAETEDLDLESWEEGEGA